jgi:hypothetical protein
MRNLATILKFTNLVIYCFNKFTMIKHRTTRKNKQVSHPNTHSKFVLPLNLDSMIYCFNKFTAVKTILNCTEKM